jgi:hypothetical protein
MAVPGGTRPLFFAFVVAALLSLTFVALAASPPTAQAEICNPECFPPEDEPPHEPPPPKPPPLGPKMLVVNVGWDTGNPATSVPPSPAMLSEAVTEMRTKVNPWYKTIAPGFRGWDVLQGPSVTIPPPSMRGCSEIALGPAPFTREVFASGDAALQARNYNLAAYGIIVYVWSRRVCAYDGVIDEVKGRRIGLEGSLIAATHELGHHLGLRHADGLLCRGADGRLAPPLTGTCTVTLSGDPFDTMGQRLVNFDGTYEGMFNAIYENALGWLNGQVVNVTAGDFSQSWTLKPLSEIGTSPRAIRLVDGERTIWLEYRQPTGLDVQRNPGLTYGLLVHLEKSNGAGTIPTSQLLDLSPQTSTEDPGLRVGQTWAIPGSEMRITLNSASPSGANVTISSQRITVPDVRGLPLGTAEARIRAVGLTPTGGGSVIDPTCVFIGVVAAQTPFGGDRVLPDRPVNLAVGAKDPSHPCV